LTNTALWVYNEGEIGRMKYQTDGVIIKGPLEEHQLYKGWNFVGVGEQFKGRSFNQLVGNCDVLECLQFR
jgi:hypothetical protein